MVGNRTVAAMEGGIEASNLRQIRKPGQQGADGCKIIRLMQGCERNVLFKVSEHAAIDSHRPIILRASVNNAVSDCAGLQILRLAQPSAGCEQSRGNITDLFDA